MNNRRKFEDGHEKVQFCHAAFRRHIDSKRDKESIKLYVIYQEIADFVNVNAETVRGWRQGKSGPNELKIIEKIGSYLHLENWRVLLEGSEEQFSENITLTSRQKDAAKRIYDVLVDFMMEYLETDGFRTFWLDCKKSNMGNPEKMTVDYIREKIHTICRVMDREFFDLHGTEIYNEFFEFFYGEMESLYEKKEDEPYCFENGMKGDSSFDEAMRVLNGIVERYN